MRRIRETYKAANPLECWFPPRRTFHLRKRVEKPRSLKQFRTLRALCCYVRRPRTPHRTITKTTSRFSKPPPAAKAKRPPYPALRPWVSPDITTTMTTLPTTPTTPTPPTPLSAFSTSGASTAKASASPARSSSNAKRAKSSWTPTLTSTAAISTPYQVRKASSRAQQ